MVYYCELLPNWNTLCAKKKNTLTTAVISLIPSIVQNNVKKLHKVHNFFIICYIMLEAADMAI